MPIADGSRDAVAALDERLGVLAQALAARDADAVAQAAEALRTAAEMAARTLRRPGATGPMEPALRHHLAISLGQVAVHREALARAAASVDRAIDVLLPRAGGEVGVYGANGQLRPRVNGRGHLSA